MLGLVLVLVLTTQPELELEFDLNEELKWRIDMGCDQESLDGLARPINANGLHCESMAKFRRRMSDLGQIFVCHNRHSNNKR